MGLIKPSRASERTLFTPVKDIKGRLRGRVCKHTYFDFQSAVQRSQTASAKIDK